MKKEVVDEKIDFVITWVDGNDENWKKTKEYYQNEYVDGNLKKWNDASCRYRDWNLLRYWFRGVERYAPWVNNIYFVTCGQKPEWLNEEHAKLRLVKHEEFIPSKYLPTYNSATIELNLHRIQGLSRTFVYFNDDMFLTKHCQPKDFFVNQLPKGTAFVCPTEMKQNGIRAEINNLYVINSKFNKRDVIRNNITKWINPIYGRGLVHTMLMLPYSFFPGLYVAHLPCSYLKDTFEEVWKEAYEVLDETCSHRFRNQRDVNPWLVEDWQYCKGAFAPRKISFGKMYEGREKIDKVAAAIMKQKWKTICCNDSGNINDFEESVKKIQGAFETILPEKSEFEKI